jgi:hypothetical protein
VNFVVQDCSRFANVKSLESLKISEESLGEPLARRREPLGAAFWGASGPGHSGQRSAKSRPLSFASEQIVDNLYVDAFGAPKDAAARLVV